MSAIPANDVPDATPAQPASQWASRITGHGQEAPEQLLANPRNWRIHPKRQQDALSEVLDRVGWVQSVIVNSTTGHVVDGHLRVALAISRGEPTLPVAYVELDDEEERLVLASLDPLAGLAGTDDGALRGLIGDLEGQLDGELGQMMAGLAKATGSVAPAPPTQDEIDQAASDLDGRFEGPRAALHDVTCPECGNDFAINLDEIATK